MDSQAEIRAALKALECGAGMTFGEVHGHVAGAVAYCLPDHGAQEWRRESPAVLAERIATVVTAGISPVMTQACVDSGARIMRDMIADDQWLARNGLQRIA